MLLSVRRDLRGWELPGGNAEPPASPARPRCAGRSCEETGLEVAVERHVGDYVRTGFRPHTARVFRCRATGGELRPSAETPMRALVPASGRSPTRSSPGTERPLADALAEPPEPVERHEHQGRAAVWAGMKIDLRMRLSDDRGRASPTLRRSASTRRQRRRRGVVREAPKKEKPPTGHRSEARAPHADR